MRYQIFSSLALCSHLSVGFTTFSPLQSSSGRTPSKLYSDNDESWLNSLRQKCDNLVSRIDTLQTEIQSTNSTDELQFQTTAVELIEEDFEQLISQPLPPLGLSMDEYVSSIRLFLNLPPSVRLAFVKALEMEDEAAGDSTRIPEIIGKLYDERSTLTPKRLKDSFELARSMKAKGEDDENLESDDQAEAVLAGFFEPGSDEVLLKNNVEQLLSRTTRNEESFPRGKDLEILTNTLDSSIFNPTGSPIEIPGGYLIRGENRKSTGEELIEALDAKLPSDWNCTVCFMSDISVGQEFDAFFGNALVLLKKDFPLATSAWLYRFISACALVTTLFFAVGVYGGNDAVLNQLSDATAIGDFSGLDWFNGKVAEVIVPLFMILASHEFGHYIVSKKERIETASFLPTLVPFWSNLPLLGSLTRITSSPKNFSALFDFALLGPLLGFISSFVFFAMGLFATQASFEGDANAAQFLPSLPVSVLKLSTLGSSIVDNFFGADGFITSQDPSTAVPLHPFAIAGFCGLLINAAEMLPLGATDGARLSLTLFGRQGQAVIGGSTWLALLIASFTLTDQQGEVLITAWIINNVIQNDMEVPCRNEIDKINLPRILIAFSLWFLAALIIIPST